MGGWEMDEELIKKRFEEKGITLNPMQNKCLPKVINSNKNQILIAPTSSGKTFIAISKIIHTLENKGRVIYAVPQKVLIDQTIEEIEKFCPNKYISGINGKDCWNKADVMVLPFESLYFNLIYQKGLIENKFKLVILDEFHLLYDKKRGFTLEKIISLLKCFNQKLFLMSATFEDKKDVEEWLNAEILDYDIEKYRQIKLIYKKLEVNNKDDKEFVDKILEIIKTGKSAIVFNSTKPFCVSRARKIYEKIPVSIQDKESSKEELIKKLGLKKENITDSVSELLDFMTVGIAYHTAAVSKDMKEMIENLFNKKKIKIIFATTTLAYGFNSPTEIIIIRDTTRWHVDEGCNKSIAVFEYLQMAGRAGRTGYLKKDAAYCYIVNIDYETFNLIQNNEIEPANSHLNIDDYFRKFLLEIIKSGSNTQQEIFNSVKSTFYNFQNESKKRIIFNLPYNFSLKGEIEGHLEFLIENEFIKLTGYKFDLTHFGDIIVNFSLKSFTQIPLGNFCALKNKLKEENKIKVWDKKSFYFLIKNFSPLSTLYKKSRKSEIEEYFWKEFPEVKHISNEEYTFYALQKGWMEGMEIKEIEDKYLIYAFPIKTVVNNMQKIIELYEEIGKTCFGLENDKNYEYKEFKKIFRFGVSKECSFLIARGEWGRDRIMKFAKKLKQLKTHNNKQNLSLKEYFFTFNPKEISKIVQKIKGLGPQAVGILINKLKEGSWKKW